MTEQPPLQPAIVDPTSADNGLPVHGEKLWFWWAGFDGEVESEGLYALGEFKTRGEAIAAGMGRMPDCDGNTFFHIVEAQFTNELAGGDVDPDDFQPFAAMRNHEVIDAGEAAHG